MTWGMLPPALLARGLLTGICGLIFCTRRKGHQWPNPGRCRLTTLASPRRRSSDHAGWADGGYAGKLVTWAKTRLRLTLEIVRRLMTCMPSKSCPAGG